MKRNSTNTQKPAKCTNVLHLHFEYNINVGIWWLHRMRYLHNFQGEKIKRALLIASICIRECGRKKCIRDFEISKTNCPPIGQA